MTLEKQANPLLPASHFRQLCSTLIILNASTTCTDTKRETLCWPTSVRPRRKHLVEFWADLEARSFACSNTANSTMRLTMPRPCGVQSRIFGFPNGKFLKSPAVSVSRIGRMATLSTCSYGARTWPCMRPSAPDVIVLWPRTLLRLPSNMRFGAEASEHRSGHRRHDRKAACETRH